MKHPPVDSPALAERLGVALSKYDSSADFCRKHAFPADRLSRFQSGQFSRMTPRLETLCGLLGVKWDDLVEGQDERNLSRLLNGFEKLNRSKREEVRRILESLAKLANL